MTFLCGCQGGTVDIVLNLIISQFYSQAIAIISLCYKQIIIYLIFHTKILKEKKSSPGSNAGPLAPQANAYTIGPRCAHGTGITYLHT